MATSVSAWLNAGLLYRGLRRDGVLRFAPGLGAALSRLLLACLAMGALLLWLDSPVEQWVAWGWQQRALNMAVVCGSGFACYLVVHLLLGTRLADLRSPRIS